MYIVKKTGYIISNYFSSHIFCKAARVTYESRLWKIWRAMITSGTCYYCASMNAGFLQLMTQEFWKFQSTPIVNVI